MMFSKTSNETRAALYRLLSRLYRSEVDAPLLDALKGMTFPADTPQQELAEGYARLRAWLESCGDTALDDLAVDYATVFLAAGSADGSAAIPCESVYTSPKKIYMQEAWEAVTSLYRAHEVGKAEGLNDLMEDHLALELAFLVHLIEENDTKGQQDFLEHHLLNWVPDFVADIDRYARQDFYKAVGLITLGLLKLDQALLSGLNDPENHTLTQAPSFSVRTDRMEPIFIRLKEKYRIFAPKRFPKRGPKGGDLIRYGEIDAITDVVYKEKSHFSPKEVFYPVNQTMFYFKGDHCEQKELEEDKDILLFLRPCDLNAVQRLDNIFLHNGQSDLYYSRMRQKVKFILLECPHSFDNCLCVSMGTNRSEDYSAAVRIDDICALVEVKDEELLPYFQDEVPIDFTPKFVTENQRTASLPNIPDRATLEKACKLDFWKQYDENCIACGTCNTVCPTCSCFDTVDVIYDETSRDGERRRVWSGCMLKDFTRTAGGGMARKTQGANMRFKVLHKVYDYNLRFGGKDQMCVGCGRCIDRCPKDIDYLDAINGLTRILAEEQEVR